MDCTLSMTRRGSRSRGERAAAVGSVPVAGMSLALLPARRRAPSSSATVMHPKVLLLSRGSSSFYPSRSR